VSTKASLNKDIKNAAALLKNGKAVVFPTDTAYGLAVDATNAGALRRLYKIKGRNFKSPVHVIFPDISSAKKAVYIGPLAKKLMKKWWPGPLTLVLRLKKNALNRLCWKILSASTKKLGLRCPKDHASLRLSKELKRPITATSANKSGMPACYSVKEVQKQFSSSITKPDYYLDGGRLKKIKPSTVVAIDSNKLLLIREGPVDFSEIKKAK
jgi:L-threonylcarbamoyladenylate synthase